MKCNSCHKRRSKVKGVADFLTDHPVSGTSKFYDDLPDEIAEVNSINASSEEQVWQLFFDRASRTNPEGNIIAGMGVVLISPHNYMIPRAFSLTEPCFNNVSKYNSLLIRMQLAKEIGIKNLGHTVIQSLSSTRFGRVQSPTWRLDPYHNATIIMAEKFENFYIDRVPCQ